MQLIKKGIYYFLHTHFFISLIAVCLAFESRIILHQELSHYYIYYFIFSSTFFAYNVYYTKTYESKLFITLSALGFILTCHAVYLLPRVFYFNLLIVSIASSIYILPIFYPFKKSRIFTLQKLLLLIFVWVVSTFVLPIKHFVPNTETFILLIHRILLLTVSCLLFFIRDECNGIYKQKAISAFYIFCGLQCASAIIVVLFVNMLLGFVYVFISIICIFLAKYFLGVNRSKIKYLLYADGIMFLQSAIIIILHYFNLI